MASPACSAPWRMASAGSEGACKAVEAMASNKPEIARLLSAIADARISLAAEIADARSDVRLLKWQIAALFAITAPTLWLVLRVAAKVGALPA
jgi:hypothetical protein